MITIIKSGLLTSIQDLGRYGYQKYGIITSGAMDQLAHRIANLLTGNDESQATLEITLIGPIIQFEEDALISICGGDLTPMINGEVIPLWRSIFIKKGSKLSFGPCKSGCRAYLAVAGGFKVPDILNSKSTYLRAGIGGFLGRALKSGDQLEIQEPSPLAKKMFQYLKNQLGSYTYKEMEWSITANLIPKYQNEQCIRVMKGREFELFTKESRKKFFTERFGITVQSDRMGYRLKGPTLKLEKSGEMLSEAVSFGTIQVPSEGNPIVLLADRQTTGGYPKIGQIASVDLPLVAQEKPGDTLTFSIISLKEAQQLYLKQEQAIQLLKRGIELKFC